MAKIVDRTMQENMVLLALRAGPLDSATLAERTGFDIHIALRACIRNGWVIHTCKDFSVGSIYAITAEGKEACPKRRNLFRLAFDQLEQPNSDDLIEMGLTA